jgi:hypothetical protein
MAYLGCRDIPETRPTGETSAAASPSLIDVFGPMCKPLEKAWMKKKSVGTALRLRKLVKSQENLAGQVSMACRWVF